jgi:hypothetical protein
MSGQYMKMFLAATAVVFMAGCTNVGESLENAEYFKQARARSEELQKQLRERVMHTQIDQERPAHQTEGYLTPG